MGIFKKKTKSKNNLKLEKWKAVFEYDSNEYEKELAKMDAREQLYAGTKDIESAGSAKAKSASHVRNVVAEIIESQVQSSIPMPKVTPIRKQDEAKASSIENMLRNILDRLPFEEMNDQQERTAPIQGGAGFLCEWDNSVKTHSEIGSIDVSELHPKKIIPQAGVYSTDRMDHIFLVLPQTKQYIKTRFGVDLDENEAESNPEVRGPEGAATTKELVEQIIAFSVNNENGGIDRYSWVNDTELEDLEDYQARRVLKCDKCGQTGDGDECSFCGSKAFHEATEEYETLNYDVERSNGSVISADAPAYDADGAPMMKPAVYAPDGTILSEAEIYMEPRQIPYYKPDVFPIVIRKNTSSYGKFLGDSDVDKITDQQRTIKMLETKAIEKTIKGGSIVALPDNFKIETTDEEMKVIKVHDAADLSKIKVFNIEVNNTQDLNLAAQAYEEARQIIGITDSFQGRRDSTATSGTAKQFSAQQAAGRLESKRVMKEAAYARLFEVMFKFMLAYADEPRPYVSADENGAPVYGEFNRWDFLEFDDAGQPWWNDQFLFSCDASSTLVNNREALWQECRMNFQQGCFGETTAIPTLLLFWSTMENLHYPGAADKKTYFQKQLAAQQQPVQQIPTQNGTAVPPAVMQAAADQASGSIANADAEDNTKAMFINGGGLER